ncbi:MAG: Calx-beta domain-containing protein [bacterium]|jgi:plastocyanin
MIKHLLVKALLLMGVFITINASAQTTHTITVAPNGTLTYSPSSLTCVVGDTVRFFYGPTSGGSHPTQSTSGAVNIPLHTLDGSNNQFKVAMTTAGVINYECVPHAGAGMVGTITVNLPFIATSHIPFTGTGTLNTNGWSTHSGTAGQLQNTTTSSDNGNSLAYTGLPASTGNRTSISSTGSEDINRVVPTINNSGSVYYSTLVKVLNTTGLQANTATGAYFMHLTDTNGTTGVSTGFVGRLQIRLGSVANTFNLGILNNSGGTPTAAQIYGATPTDLSLNQTYLVVVKYTYSTNSASIWINPTISSTEPTSTVTFNAITGNNPAPTKSKAICIRQASGTGNVEIDEIRVRNNWSDVLGIIPPPALRFNPTSISVNENAGTATVSVSLANANANATSVDVVVKGGSATAGSDYTYTTQTVTFPANTTTAQTFTFPIIDDASQENDETIELVLRNNTNSSVINADSILTITIPVNDVAAPVITISSADTINTAEGQSVIVSLSIVNANSTPTSVKLMLKGTSTANAADVASFDATNGVTYTFPANSSASISDTIDIVDDNIAELAENAVLVLRDATNSALIGSDSLQTIIIATNDQPLMAHFVGATANANENAGTINVSVMAMATTTTGATSFDVVVKSSTATAGTDFNYSSTTITIPGGKDSTVVLPINILNDTDVETDENIVLVIRNITNNGMASDSIYTITIKSDDIASYSISQIRENDANGVSLLTGTKVNVKGIVYGVDMQGSATSLQYTLIDPSAGVGIFRSGANNPPAITIVPVEGDSASVWGTVGEFNGLTQINMDSIKIISSGNTLKQPRVITSLDETTESNLVIFRNAVAVDTTANTGSGTTVIIASGTDTLTLRVDADVTLFGQALPAKFNVVGLGGQFDNSNPKNTGYQLLPRSAADVVAVIDPAVTLDSATYSVSEATATKTVRVKLSTPSNGTSTVNIAVTGGTATSADYQFVGGLVTFAHGESEKSFNFSITNDAATETNETVLFSLSNAVNATLGTPSSATLTIIDNDAIGLNANKVENLNIYPNPTKDILYLTASEKINTVNIINMMGQVVKSVKVNANNTNINVEDLSAGIYSVVVNSDNAQSTQKLIVK